MGCICSSARPSSPRPSPPPAVDPIIRTTIGDSKGSTLFFNDQDFDRAILPKMDEDKRNTLLQPDGALIVKVCLQLPPERPLLVHGPARDIEWKYVVTKVESYYKFELQGTNDRREVARAMDLVEGDEVTLEYKGDDSIPCFSISHEEMQAQPKPLLKICGDPKDGTFLFTNEEFERHILPEMTDADQNTLSRDDGTLNVTILYLGRELPFVLSKVEGHYKFEYAYADSEGFTRRPDELREGDLVRLRYLNQASFSLKNTSTRSIFLPN